MFQEHLIRQQPFVAGLPSSTAVLQTQMMLNALIAQIGFLHRKHKKIHIIVVNNPIAKVREIIDIVKISVDVVHHILH